MKLFEDGCVVAVVVAVDDGDVVGAAVVVVVVALLAHKAVAMDFRQTIVDLRSLRYYLWLGSG